MKPTLLLILAITLFSCAENTEQNTFDKFFFVQEPFSGAKGNVEWINSVYYREPDTHTPNQEKEYIYKITTYFSTEGLTDSVLWIKYKYGEQDSITSMYHYTYNQDKEPTKMVEEIRKGNQYRKIETIYQRVNPKRTTIIAKDLTNPSVEIPEGFIKFDFKNQTMDYQHTKDQEMNEDVVERVVKTYKNRKEIKTENKNQETNYLTCITNLNDEGLAKNITYITRKFFFFDDKAISTFQYFNKDEKENYRQTKFVYKKGDIEISTLIDNTYSYRE